MKTLYLDCSMGISGDMLAGALLQLAPDPEAAIAHMNSFGIPGVSFSAATTRKCGIAATRFCVEVRGVEEKDWHRHAHSHGHEKDSAGQHGHGHNAHVHRSLHDMLHAIDHLNLDDAVKEQACAVYREIALAESKAHGRPVGEIHFHEVGAADAVADICAVCWLMAEIRPDEVVSSPVHVGCGTVQCAHGEMPVPAPATAFLLEGVPSYSDGAVRGELCTPTGAALLRRFAGSFGPLPLMRVSSTGAGAGSRDFERPNILRAFLGERCAAGAADFDFGGGRAAEVLELSFSVDDMTGEEIAFAARRIFAAGAKDVWTAPVSMKKGRPGTAFTAIFAPEDREAAIRAIFGATSTLGVREKICRRYEMARTEKTVHLPDGGSAKLKTSRGFGAVREKLAADDLEAAATRAGTSMADVRNAAARLCSDLTGTEERTNGHE